MEDPRNSNSSKRRRHGRFYPARRRLRPRRKPTSVGQCVLPAGFSLQRPNARTSSRLLHFRVFALIPRCIGRCSSCRESLCLQPATAEVSLSSAPTLSGLVSSYQPPRALSLTPLAHFTLSWCSGPSPWQIPMARCVLRPQSPKLSLSECSYGFRINLIEPFINLFLFIITL